MSSSEFDDIIRDFAQERQASGADEQDAGLGEPIPTTSLLVVPVREGGVLAGVLKSGGGKGSVFATDQGCLVELAADSGITPQEAANELSGMLPGADLILLTKQGGPQDEGQITCERIRDAQVVEKPVVAMIIDVLPAQARRVLLMGERLSAQGGSVDIESSPDPPGDRRPRLEPAAGSAGRAVAAFDNLLVFVVLLGGVLLVVQGLGVFTDHGVSWVQLVFGAFMTLWCLWRLSPAGRARVRRR